MGSSLPLKAGPIYPRALDPFQGQELVRVAWVPEPPVIIVQSFLFEKEE